MLGRALGHDWIRKLALKYSESSSRHILYGLEWSCKCNVLI
jgi:hypothetical protein